MDSLNVVVKRDTSFKSKRRSTAVRSSVIEKVQLEKVLGLTVVNSPGLDTCPHTGTVAYLAGCVVVLYTPKTNRQTYVFNVSKKTLSCVAFSGDGKLIATGENGHQPAVRVWDVEDGSQVCEFHGHKFGINCVAFSSKYLVSIGSQHDMIVNVWNWKINCKVASNKVATKVSGIAFSEDGSYFVTVGNRHVKFWYLDASKSRINETVPLMGRSGIMGDLKYNHFCGVACGRGQTGGSTFVITHSGQLCEFNQQRQLDKWVELITPSAYSLSVGETQIFVGCANGIIRVFSALTLHFITSLPHPHFLGIDVALGRDPSQLIPAPRDAQYPDAIAVSYHADSRVVTCVYNDHSLYVWDVSSVTRVGKLRSMLYHSSAILGVDVYPPTLQDKALPEGSFITCSSDQTIRIWNLTPHMDSSTSYSKNIYSPELLKIIYTDSSYTHLVDKEFNPAGKTDQTDDTFQKPHGIRTVRVSPEGQHLASGDRLGNVRIHDLHTAEELHMFAAHESEVLSLEYTDPRVMGVHLLASTSRDRLLHVFACDQDYGFVQTLNDHSSGITAVKFAVSSKQLNMISCGFDKSLLFRTAHSNPDLEFALNRHLVSKTSLCDMDIDPAMKVVAVACQDRMIRIYNLQNGKQKKSYSGAVSSEGTLLRVQLDPSGRYIATSSSDKSITILDFYTGQLLATMCGHSEVVTGIKFTNDLQRLITISGDGCIFVWRLPASFMEAANNNNTSTSISVHPRDTNANPFPRPADQVDNDASMQYRFSIGGLPAWARKHILHEEGGQSPKAVSVPGMPAGCWGQRGPEVVLQQENDASIHINLLDTDSRRRPCISQVSIITDDDENNKDDEIDDFRPSQIVPSPFIPLANSSVNYLRGSKLLSTEEEDVLSPIYYPRENEEQPKAFNIVREQTIGECEGSEGTDIALLEDLEEDDSGASKLSTPDQEKFVKENFDDFKETFSSDLSSAQDRLDAGIPVSMLNNRLSFSFKFFKKGEPHVPGIGRPPVSGPQVMKKKEEDSRKRFQTQPSHPVKLTDSPPDGPYTRSKATKGCRLTTEVGGRVGNEVPPRPLAKSRANSERNLLNAVDSEAPGTSKSLPSYAQQTHSSKAKLTTEGDGLDIFKSSTLNRKGPATRRSRFNSVQKTRYQSTPDLAAVASAIGEEQLANLTSSHTVSDFHKAVETDTKPFPREGSPSSLSTGDRITARAGSTSDMSPKLEPKYMNETSRSLEACSLSDQDLSPRAGTAGAQADRDRLAMPPPATAPWIPNSRKVDSTPSLYSAVRRRTDADMTLSQATDILLGRSSYLPNSQKLAGLFNKSSSGIGTVNKSADKEPVDSRSHYPSAPWRSLGTQSSSSFDQSKLYDSDKKVQSVSVEGTECTTMKDQAIEPQEGEPRTADKAATPPMFNRAVNPPATRDATPLKTTLRDHLHLDALSKEMAGGDSPAGSSARATHTQFSRNKDMLTSLLSRRSVNKQSESPGETAWKYEEITPPTRFRSTSSLGSLTSPVDRRGSVQAACGDAGDGSSRREMNGEVDTSDDNTDKMLEELNQIAATLRGKSLSVRQKEKLHSITCCLSQHCSHLQPPLLGTAQWEAWTQQLSDQVASKVISQIKMTDNHYD